MRNTQGIAEVNGVMYALVQQTKEQQETSPCAGCAANGTRYADMLLCNSLPSSCLKSGIVWKEKP